MRAIVLCLYFSALVKKVKKINYVLTFPLLRI